MKPGSRLHSQYATSLWALLLLGLVGPLAHAELTPSAVEKEILNISKYLKPIADEQWKEIANARISENYKIEKGDTLYDISQRLFGDPRYWPKIWALNNKTITNPHLIRPGNLIAFMPGSGAELPAVAINDAGEAVQVKAADSEEPEDPPEPEDETDAPRSKRRLPKGKSREWSRLPPQRWERIQRVVEASLREGSKPITIPSKSTLPQIKFELHAIATSDTLDNLGDIYGSNSAGLYLGPGDLLYIHGKSKLTVGETYTITRSPTRFGGSRYSYMLLGTVRILDSKEDLYIGKLVTSRHFINRGTFLIPHQQRIPTLNPITTPRGIEAEILIDHNESTFLAAQGKQVFLGAGSDDGVTPGMVFKLYEHKDPATAKRISEKNIRVFAELMAVQVSPKFSVAVIVSSNFAVNEGMIATTVADSFVTKETPSVKEVTPEDDLEKMDVPEEKLREEEERELRQLEQWRSNPPPAPDFTPSPSVSPSPSATPTPSPTPEPSPSPAAEIPPPPPPESMEGTPPPGQPAPSAPPEAELPAPPADAPSEPIPPENPATPGDSAPPVAPPPELTPTPGI